VTQSLLLTILAEVTVRDGIGMDDLTWLAGLISVVAVITDASILDAVQEVLGIED